MEDTQQTASLEAKRGLYRKISGLRQELLTLDWSDDKIMKAASMSYPYLSTDKVKRNIAPLFHKHGLEVRVYYDELEPRPAVGDFTSHWTVRINVEFIDMDSCATVTYHAYGEATDKNDKAINKAQTSAFKQWVMSTFGISDGIDPEMVIGGGGSFHRRSEEEEEEVRSRVLANAEKPPAPKPPAPKKAPKKEEPAPEVHEEPKAEPAPAPEAQESPKVEDDAPAPGYKPMGVQAKAIDRITSVYEQRAKAGEISPEEYNQMSMDCASISSVKDATAFIKKYRVG